VRWLTGSTRSLVYSAVSHSRNSVMSTKHSRNYINQTDYR